ncbi:MAG: hypothetical protein WBW93_17650 [Steroidobacteraceae bacterium]
MNLNVRLKATTLFLALASISIGCRNFWTTANAAATIDAMTASMVLQRVATVYATAKTYQDTGVVKPTGGGAATFLSDVPFSTAYRAPDRFRFAFVAMHPVMIQTPALRGITYRNGKDVEQWAFSKLTAPSSLDIAIASATGVSSSAAYNIPALLMPQLISGRKFTDDANAELLPETPCDRHTCYRVQESHSRGRVTEIVWIDRTSFLVRRIEYHLTLPNDVTSSFSTIYQPVINAPVADSALELDAPTSGTGSAAQSTSSPAQPN